MEGGGTPHSSDGFWKVCGTRSRHTLANRFFLQDRSPSDPAHCSETVWQVPTDSRSGKAQSHVAPSTSAAFFDAVIKLSFFSFFLFNETEPPEVPGGARLWLFVGHEARGSGVKGQFPPSTLLVGGEVAWAQLCACVRGPTRLRKVTIPLWSRAGAEEQLGAMAAGTLRALSVAGGGESSDSEDDGWDIGYLDRSSQKLKRSLPVEDKNETFKKALTTGDINLVKELLDSGINVDSSFRYGWTPLMYAASVANVEMVRFLLDRGANASFDKDKLTILITACSARGSEEHVLKCVELLLSRNADPNVACRRLMTPIMYAARDGHTQVVALLVAHGAEVNAQDENGYTALTWAARQGHKNVILKLLELGANKMIQTKDGRTPSEIAKRNKHLEIFNFLSFTLNPLEGKLQQLTKEETICKLLATDSDKEKDHIFSPYTAFGDLEIFLHGLGLEHMTDLLKERDITLRQLLSMKKDELTKNGITSKDQQKILAALKELEVEEINFGKLPEVAKLEISGDEFLNFLLKLNKQCGHLITAVQNIITELPVNSHKIVLEWASPRSFTSVCEELVSNVEDLNEEVCKLKDLIQKMQKERENDPTHVPLVEEVSTWKSRILKRSAVTVCGFGLLLFICKLTCQRK